MSNIKLPVNVKIRDISVHGKEGSDFNNHIGFCKQTITEALTTPQTFKQDE